MKRSARMFGRLLPAFLVAIVLGGLLTQHAGAVKNSPRQTIMARVIRNYDYCKDLGGNQEVEYTYDKNGRLIKAVTTCNGGAGDGDTCTFTAAETNCTPGSTISTGTQINGNLSGQIVNAEFTTTSTGPATSPSRTANGTFDDKSQ